MYIMQPKLDPARNLIKYFDLKKKKACMYRSEYSAADYLP